MNAQEREKNLQYHSETRKNSRSLTIVDANLVPKASIRFKGLLKIETKPMRWNKLTNFKIMSAQLLSS